MDKWILHHSYLSLLEGGCEEIPVQRYVSTLTLWGWAKLAKRDKTRLVLRKLCLSCLANYGSTILSPFWAMSLRPLQWKSSTWPATAVVPIMFFFCWPQQRSLIILWSDNGLNATSCPRRFAKFEAWATGHVKMHHGNSRRQDICLIFFFAMARPYMKTIIERRSKHWFDYMVPSMCETEPQYNIFLSSQCQAAQVENDTAGCKMRSGCPSQESTSSYFNSIAL